MRSWAVGLGFLLFWTCIIDARAQDTVTATDTVFRAAYCAAAIDVIRRERSREAFKKFCEDWQSDGFPTIDQCIEMEWQRVDEEFAKKQQRFHDYVMLFACDADDEMMTQIAEISARAKRDVEVSLKETGVGVECEASCAGATGVTNHMSCMYQCIARTNPTHAGIFRCIVLPDDLPF
jgi:hypothetical protein